MLDAEQNAATGEQSSRLAGLANEEISYLTTFDRDSGAAQEDEMWFAAYDDTIFMLADNGGDTQWVRNILSNPEVSIRIDGQTFAGMARVVVNHPDEETAIRERLRLKYQDKREDGAVARWSSDALPIAIDL